MGMQISCGVHTEMPAQDAVCAIAAGSGDGVSGFGRAEGVRCGRGASDAHMLLSVPPKYLVSSVMGFIKGKSAIHIARVYAGRRRNFVGQHFWARGYWVSTVGKNEAAVRRYIQDQEKEDQRLEQLELAAL